MRINGVGSVTGLLFLIGTQIAFADRVVLVAGGGTLTGAVPALKAQLETPF